MEKTALIIIFNHKYNKNIPVLDKIYNKRFSEIVYIVPFYKTKELDENYNIISVYDSSYTFEGYIAQAAESLKKMDVDHFLFIGDDLILNPHIDERNYKEYFSLDSKSSYTTEICKLNEKMERYSWNFERVYENVNRFKENRFVNAFDELPKPEKAFEIANRKAKGDFYLKKNFYRRTPGLKGGISYLIKKLPKEMQYPLFCGYSDLIVISKADFDEFARICGVFSAMGIFVEIAIPTAMVLTCNNIVQQKNTSYQRGDMWGMDVKESFAKRYHYSLTELENEWDETKLFVHPVKLSKWSMK